MATKLLFIRHGYSTANDLNIFGGRGDYDLTEKGEYQASLTGKYVLGKYKVDKVYSSNLSRAIKTAEKIAKPLNLKINVDKRLSEIYGGIWEGLNFSDIERDYPEQFATWRDDLSKAQPPEGENLKDVLDRATKAVKEIAESNDGKTVVIVTHRVVLRALQCVFNNIPLDRVNEVEWIANCSVSEVEYDGGKLIPINVNQCEFLGELLTKVTTDI